MFGRHRSSYLFTVRVSVFQFPNSAPCHFCLFIEKELPIEPNRATRLISPTFSFISYFSKNFIKVSGHEKYSASNDNPLSSWQRTNNFRDNSTMIVLTRLLYIGIYITEKAENWREIVIKTQGCGWQARVIGSSTFQHQHTTRTINLLIRKSANSSEEVPTFDIKCIGTL